MSKGRPTKDQIRAMFESYYSLQVGNKPSKLRWEKHRGYVLRATQYHWLAFYTGFHKGSDLATTGKIREIDFRDYEGEEDAA